MPIPLRRSGSARRGPFRGPHHRAGRLWSSARPLPVSLAFPSAPLPSCPRRIRGGQVDPRQVLRRSTFFSRRRAALARRVCAGARIRRLVYRNYHSPHVRPFPSPFHPSLRPPWRFRRANYRGPVPREHPGLNVNSGITAWLEDYQRRARITKAKEGSARQKVVNFLRVIIRLRGFARAAAADSRSFAPSSSSSPPPSDPAVWFLAPRFLFPELMEPPLSFVKQTVPHQAFFISATLRNMNIVNISRWPCSIGTFDTLTLNPLTGQFFFILKNSL